MRRNMLKVDVDGIPGDFGLDSASDNEGSRLFENDLEEPKKPRKMVKMMTVEEQMLWYARASFIVQCIIMLCIIGFSVAVVILIPVTVTSPGVKRATDLMEKVFEMHDYTKTMTDVTTGSKTQIEGLLQTYKVDEMVQGLKDMMAHSRNLLQGLQPATVDAASQTAKKLVDALSNMDMERGKQLVDQVTSLMGAVHPQDVSKALEQGAIFLQKGNEALTQASQTNLVQHLSQVAASTVDLESRLMRTSEVIVKLPVK
jgi:hypothetical protein